MIIAYNCIQTNLDEQPMAHHHSACNMPNIAAVTVIVLF